MRGYRHVLARPVGSRETHQISRDLVPRDLVTSLIYIYIYIIIFLFFLSSMLPNNVDLHYALSKQCCVTALLLYLTWTVLNSTQIFSHKVAVWHVFSTPFWLQIIAFLGQLIFFFFIINNAWWRYYIYI